ncbi:hypothetical protein Amsp01_064680 [Amycolatopsis sp. NBRC 101858]|uniref:hypothetical protein n=1 Tax=Amycolatopsis sp. NBRC 101858 TaxID=3032200 RepID=UPI0024A1A32A|nr:hypothetical protein [Amycolatopsis sp. NBRC 101858]GLY40445.1 hypothetical protein Amsp01_064680 [Amycolatopsis sp. NBRC 101858]
MEAVGRQLVGRHVVADVPGLRRFREQVVLGLRDVLAAVQQRRQFGAVVLPAPLVLDHRVGVEHLVEPFAGRAVPVADFGQPGQVGADVAVVPGGQDRLNVGEVLVSPCSATRSAVASRVASCTASRCASIVSFHSFGTLSS